MSDRVPDPRELDDAPELAALAVLETALRVAVSSLLCAYPGIDDPDRPYWVRRPLSEKVAERIVARAGALAGLARNYRAALLVAKTPQPPETDRPLADLPF
jgi:hypothetical protein